MKIVTVNLPKKTIETLDELVGLNYFSSRSEAIRTAVNILIRDVIRSNFMLEELKRGKEIGSVNKNLESGKSKIQNRV